MKKSVRKHRGKFNVKKTLPYKLLIISVLILLLLIIGFIIIKISEKEEEELRGELGTLKWDFNQEVVVLDVLSYTIYNNNQTVNVKINWSSGNKNINAIFINFFGIETGCNYTRANDLIFGENKTYTINSSDSNLYCSESNFSDVTGVEAYAEVDIHLTQTALIPNITFYKDDSRQNLINLGQYFFSLVNINYTVVESPNNENISVSVNNITKNISISVLDGSWHGAQKFNLTAVSDDGDVLDAISSGENISFFIVVVNANRPVPNTPPSFNSTACDDLEWEVNTNYVLDMKKCWYDLDGDNLTGYRYENSSSYNKNLTIIPSSSNLTLAPNTNWVGNGYFYVYASDSKNEKGEQVHFDVVNSTIVNNTNLSRTNTTTTNDPKIKNSNPSTSEVYMFPGNKTFSITAENYNTIKWYLNGTFVHEGDLSYEFSNLKDGDIIKVEVINGTRIDSKTWDIKIQGDESGEEPVFDVGNVIFYSIIAILCIIILLVIWLFIIEKNKGRKVGVGFGVSGSESNVKITGERGSSLDYFNIPS